MNIPNLSDEQLNNMLSNFAGKIDNYSGTLTLTIEEVADVKADHLAFDYVTDIHNRIKKHSKDWTAYKNLLRSSAKTVSTGDVPLWTPPPAPAISKTDINSRFSKLIQRIKNHPKYTEAIGQDLGIVSIGSSLSVAEKTAMKPVLKIHLVAGQPVVEWRKGDAEGIEFHKAEGNGEYHFLETDMHPHFHDKSPLPTPGQSVVWKYKAIYHINDERVGQWSDEVSVSVMG
jgi:hypothetical protein